jgi:hypothetical protein
MLKYSLHLFSAVTMLSFLPLAAAEQAATKTETPAAAPASSTEAPAFKGELYMNKEKGYSIEFPAGWTKQERFMGLDVIALSPADTPKDSFRENASVLSGKLDAPITLDLFYSENLKNLQKALNNFKLEGSGDINVDGQAAKWVLYTHKQGNFESKVIQYFIMKGDYAYLITCGGEPTVYDKYKSTFESIVKSFKFLKEGPQPAPATETPVAPPAPTPENPAPATPTKNKVGA